MYNVRMQIEAGIYKTGLHNTRIVAKTWPKLEFLRRVSQESFILIVTARKSRFPFHY